MQQRGQLKWRNLYAYNNIQVILTSSTCNYSCTAGSAKRNFASSSKNTTKLNKTPWLLLAQFRCFADWERGYDKTIEIFKHKRTNEKVQYSSSVSWRIAHREILSTQLSFIYLTRSLIEKVRIRAEAASVRLNKVAGLLTRVYRIPLRLLGNSRGRPHARLYKSPL